MGKRKDSRQIQRHLQTADRDLAKGLTATEVCRRHGSRVYAGGPVRPAIRSHPRRKDADHGRRFVAEPDMAVGRSTPPWVAVSGGWNGDMHVWDVKGGRETACFRELHAGRVHGVAVAPDGLRVLSGSYEGSMILWDIRTGAVLRRFKTSSKYVTHVALWSDGQRALAADDDEILYCDVDSGTELGRKRADAGFLTCVALSLDGRHALSAGDRDSIQVWDLETMTEVRRFEGHVGPIWRIVYSPDGRRALSCGADRTVRLWDVGSGAEIICLRGHTDHVYSVAFSPDGRKALSASQDGSARLWMLPAGLGSRSDTRRDRWLANRAVHGGGD